MAPIILNAINKVERTEQVKVSNNQRRKGF